MDSAKSTLAKPTEQLLNVIRPAGKRLRNPAQPPQCTLGLSIWSANKVTSSKPLARLGMNLNLV